LKNMTKNKTRSIILLAALGLVAILGVAAYRVADAATPVVPVVAHGRGFGINLKGGYDRESLANALGISVDELNAAYQAASENAINQALADGLITQDQAARLSERATALRFQRGWFFLTGSDINFDALLADALGVSVETLEAAYQQAFQTRIDQAVADGKLTETEADLVRGQQALFSNDAFRSSMKAAFEAAVQEAVENGVITQSQADQILSSQSGRLLNFRGGMRGFGRHGGFDGQMPEGQNSLPTDTTNSDGL
jgi:hypothetical protein